MVLDEVECQEDFDELMSIYRGSLASTDVKEAGIQRAKARFPQYDRDRVHQVSKEVLQGIKDSEAEIPRSFD